MVPSTPCFVCGKELDNAFTRTAAQLDGDQHGNDQHDVNPDGIYQPWGGTRFMSDGNHGSSAFDPQDGTQLSLIICDEHLTNNPAAVLLFVTHQRTEVKCQPWGSHEN